MSHIKLKCAYLRIGNFKLNLWYQKLSWFPFILDGRNISSESLILAEFEAINFTSLINLGRKSIFCVVDNNARKIEVG